MSKSPENTEKTIMSKIFSNHNFFLLLFKSIFPSLCCFPLLSAFWAEPPDKLAETFVFNNEFKTGFRVG
jgi:hypothetical protein